MAWADLDKTDWDPLGSKQAVEHEINVMHDGDQGHALKMARELLDQNAPLAVHSIVHLALHSPNERVRLSAAQEILTRTMGPAKDQAIAGGDTLTDLVKTMTGSN
jgi:1,2-phenylacetyl-CoA epoxidase PaaB subunit